MREEFARLVEIVATLRSPEGCPWDREQTIDSLKPYVLEETYEVVEAIDRGDHAALREELGDFVFEAVFLAQLESEAGHFTIADSLTAIAEKLIRRHPHVFARQDGEAPVSSAGEVVTRWEQIKAQERGGAAKPKTLLGGVPAALPALLRAYQIGLRAKSVGFDWLRPADVVDKIQEEVDEVRAAVANGSAASSEQVEEEMGDLLFTIANLSRQLGIEPETALRKANDKFTRRFESMEQAIEQAGRAMRDLDLEELERHWQRAKSGPPAG
jgi:tetrapyrrole methylase family protein/MazG family protein/ATP diphosphatase